MGFSQNAIAFYLQVEDTLSPTLVKAEKSYGKFVKKLDSWNTKAFQSASKGFAGISKIIGGAMSGLSMPKSRSNMRVTVEFSKASQKLTGTNVARAVAIALRKASFAGQKGALKIPRFASGGIVGGKTPSNPGPPKDNIQALVSEGERIMSAKDSNAADAALGKMRNAKGQFLPKGSNKEIDGISRAFDGLTASLEDMADAQEMGLDPKDPAKYAAQLEKVTAVQKHYFAQVQKMEKHQQAKHIPRMKEMNRQLELLKANAGKAKGPLETLLTKVLGPARFLAISNALENVQENFLDISQASNNLADTFELGKAAEGLVTNLLQANRVMRLSSEELGQLRDRLLDNMKVVPLAVRDINTMTEAFQSLIEGGMAREDAEQLNITVGLLAESASMAADEIAPLAIMLRKNMGMSLSDSQAAMATWSAQAAAAGIPVALLTDSMDELMTMNAATFASMGPEQSGKILKSMSALVAGAEATLKGGGADMATLLSDLSGTDAELVAAQDIAFGASRETLRMALESGTVSLRGFGKQSAETAAVLGQSFGKTPKMMQFLTADTHKANAAITRAGKASVTAGDSTKYLSKVIWDTRTTFQKFQGAIGNALGGAFPDLLQFFKDLNPLVILSTGYLLQQFKVFSMLGKLGPVLGRLLVPLTSGKVAAGMGTGLGAGLAALGKAAAAAVAPIAWIAAGLAVAVGLIVYFRKEIGAFLSGVWAGFVDAMEPLKKELQPAIEALTEVFGYLFGALSDGAQSSTPTLEWLIAAGRDLGSVLATIVKVPLTLLILGFKYLVGVGEVLAKLLSGDLTGASETFDAMLAGMWETLKNMLGLDKVFAFWGEVFSDVGVIIGGVWDTVLAKATEFGSYILGTPGRVIDAFAMVGTFIANAMGLAVDAVAAKFTAMIDWAKDKWDGVKAFFGFEDTPAPAILAGVVDAVPAFASGGLVTGGRGGVDDVLALLSRGEMVVPAATTAKLSAEASNPLVSYPMLSRASIDTVSTPGMSGDNRVVEILDAILATMKDQVAATRANVPIPGSTPSRGGSPLGRSMATGGF